MSTPPLVRVVVVDHDGGSLTEACLRSLRASAWPADRLQIVLVDNASRVPLVDRLPGALLDGVTLVRSPVNRGFAGGVNLGLLDRGDADVVALVNNDATVSPDWLGPLVATLADPAVGAACPKILLADRAVTCTVEARTRRRGLGDRRDLGVRVSGARVGDVDVWSRTRLVEGFWGFEPMPRGEAGGQWTAARAVLRVPVPADGPAGPVTLRLAADVATPVTVRSGDHGTASTAGPVPAWVGVEPRSPAVDVINNVGSVRHPDGSVSDRGWLEVDTGQYDAPTDVPVWCGGAVALSRAYLDDVGVLDERLFLYYEDVELSLRGAARGWRYRTAPASVVRHVHAATSVEGSTFKERINDRNRLLVAARHDAPGVGAAAAVRYALATGSYARRDLVAPLLRGDRPDVTIVRRRLGALGGWARGLPAALRDRRPDPR